MMCGHAANAVCNSKGGVKYDPPIPSCAICSCTQQVDLPPELKERTAICCTEASIKPSSFDLAFFEFRGEFSPASTHCTCGYHKAPHYYDWPNGDRVSKKPPKGMCDQYTPKGAWPHDHYYCGHAGWD